MHLASALRRTFGAPNSSEAWRLAEADLLQTGALQGEVKMLALALSSDKSSKRTFGQGSFHPMYATILNETEETKNTIRSRLLLG